MELRAVGPDWKGRHHALVEPAVLELQHHARRDGQVRLAREQVHHHAPDTAREHHAHHVPLGGDDKVLFGHL